MLTGQGLAVCALLLASLLADALVRPRGGGLRRPAGLVLHLVLMLAGYGLFLALCGAPVASAVLVVALMAALAMVSNAKRAVLGEPLLFTDLALARSVFRHPQFYLSALPRWQIGLLGLGAVALLAVLAGLFVPVAGPHLAGLAVFFGALAGLALLVRLPPWSSLASEPDAEADVAGLGLLATLLLHWLRWRQTPDPPPCAEPLPGTPESALVLMVQCESFCDPAELFGDAALALPGLAAARAQAWRWGRLGVSGFGAYTMRTEYGVLFGRSEAALGFRRFDPFLTAVGEASHALPHRLGKAGWRCLFVHPHDMSFYGRDRIMPAAGFSELVGADRFAPPGEGEGRYVTDAAMADVLGELVRNASGPAFIHAVTIENHGPWPADGGGGALQSSAYIRLVRNSDAMLVALMRDVAALRRPALLVFFGDHRPSIPGLSMPGGARHTPFVMLRFDAEGRPQRGHGAAEDLTPAELHHAVLAALCEKVAAG